MSKSEIIFSVHDLTSEIDNDSYHSFSCAIEINGLKEDEIICFLNSSIFISPFSSTEANLIIAPFFFS